MAVLGLLKRQRRRDLAAARESGLESALANAAEFCSGLVLALAACSRARRAAEPLELLGQPIAPGDRRTGWRCRSATSVGGESSTPVIVVVGGAQPGPVVCLTGGHPRRRAERGRGGAALARARQARRAARDADRHADREPRRVPARLALPARSPRPEPLLPGQRPRQLGASRLARSLFERACATATRWSTCTRARSTAPTCRRCAATCASPRCCGSRRRSAARSRCTTRAGPARCAARPPRRAFPRSPTRRASRCASRSDEIDRGVRGVELLLASLACGRRPMPNAPSPAIYFRSRWMRADDGGILSARVRTGRHGAAEPGAGHGLRSDLEPSSSKIRAPAARARDRRRDRPARHARLRGLPLATRARPTRRTPHRTRRHRRCRASTTAPGRRAPSSRSAPISPEART